VRHREGLAAAGDAEQDLMLRPAAGALEERLDGLRLVALRREGRLQAKRTLSTHRRAIIAAGTARSTLHNRRGCDATGATTHPYPEEAT
jgi:hypothetical protein